MEHVLSFFENLLGTSDWPARWACGQWTSFHGWLYIFSSLAIWSAYFAIPFILFVVVRKKQDVPFKRIFWLFILFIFACGTTHFIDATMFYYPLYRLTALVLFGTAVISWVTVFGLIKILPEALLLKSPVQLEKIIHERTGELEQINMHLKKVNSDLDSFVYSASHDLKSPLNNIEALTSMIEADIRAGEQPDVEALTRIKISVHKLKETIVKLSDIARVQKDPYDDVELLKVSELLKEVLIENQVLFSTHGAVVQQSLEANTLSFSRIAFKSILYNLMTNAIKYASDDRSPVLEITTKKSGGKFILKVKDNGLGIDLDRNGDKLFKLFKRLHDHVEGSGIGLYTIKNIVEAKGGSIEVESELNRGSTFTVVLMENV